MPSLTYYRQKRYDQTIHTGIELDGDTLSERYESESDEPNPILLWWVDLRCNGARVPTEPDDVRDWLLKHAQLIRDGFQEFGERLHAGVDTDAYPLSFREFPRKLRGVEMAIVCSAVRRVDGRELGEVLKSIGENWETLVNQLWTPHELEERR